MYKYGFILKDSIRLKIYYNNIIIYSAFVNKDKFNKKPEFIITLLYGIQEYFPEEDNLDVVETIKLPSRIKLFEYLYSDFFGITKKDNCHLECDYY